MKIRLKLLLLVLLSLAADAAFGQQNNFMIQSGSKWPTHTVYASWINPDAATEAQRQIVKDAVTNSWVKNSDLKIVWVDNGANKYGIRIMIQDVRPYTNHLGRFVNNQDIGMVLNLSFKSWKPVADWNDVMIQQNYAQIVGVIAIHEFGHALGFAHEQNRGDCPECDKKPEGDFGDWGTPVCDMNSIMNYCNNHLMDGKLSDGDIQGIQALYGLPADATVNNASSLTLLHTVLNNSNGVNAAPKINVFLAGSPAELNKVKSIEYHLPPGNDQQTLTANKDSVKLGIQVRNADSTNFRLSASVFFKDGSKKELATFITYDSAQAGNLPDSAIRIIYQLKRRYFTGLKYRFKFSIDTTSAAFPQIVRVEYTRDDPSFTLKTIRSDDKSSGFYIDWIGWGCLENFRIRAYYVDKDKLYFKDITFDMCNRSNWPERNSRVLPRKH